MLPCFDLQALLTMTFRLTIIAVFPVIPQLKVFAFPSREFLDHILVKRFFPSKECHQSNWTMCPTGLTEKPEPRMRPGGRTLPQYFSDSEFGRLFSLLRDLECLCQHLLVSTSKAPEHPPPHHSSWTTCTLTLETNNT